MSYSRPVLIVEDNLNNVFLMQLVLRDLQSRNPLRVVPDSGKALAYLEGSGEYKNRRAHPFPALLILDLKLPVLSGIDLLPWLRAHPKLKARVPVIARSPTVTPELTRWVTALGADELVKKPIGYQELKQQMQAMATRWLEPGSTTDSAL